MPSYLEKWGHFNDLALVNAKGGERPAYYGTPTIKNGTSPFVKSKGGLTDPIITGPMPPQPAPVGTIGTTPLLPTAKPATSYKWLLILGGIGAVLYFGSQK